MNPSAAIESVVQQTQQIASWIPGADPTAAVPTCPEWVFRDLVEHVGATQRWVSRLVTEQVSDPMAAFGIGWEKAPESAAQWPDWLAAGLDDVVTAFGNPPAGASVFDPSGGADGVSFWSTRLFGEVAVHRIDAAFTTGHAYRLAPDLAGAAVDDWLGTITSAGWAANVAGFTDAMRGAGQTVSWVARDLDRSWIVRRSDAPLELVRATAQDAVPAGEGAAVVEADALDLLHLVSRRRPLDEADASSIRGDRAELEHLVANMNWEGA